MDAENPHDGHFNGGVRGYGRPVRMDSNLSASNISISNASSDKFAPVRDLRQVDPRTDKSRIESQRGLPLVGSFEWVFDHPSFTEWEGSSSGILWIRGDPGKGKTMIMVGAVNEMMKRKADRKFKASTISFFFCESGDKFHNNAVSVLRGLLCMLLEQHPESLVHLERAYQSAGSRLFEDSDSTLFYTLQGILLEILKDKDVGPTCLMLDALDECETDLELLLSLILQTANDHKVLWVISSRKTHDILTKLRTKCSVIDLEINHHFVEEAVEAYIEEKVKHFDADIQDEVASYLLEKSEGTFLWVHLVCQRLEEVPEWNVLDELRKFPEGLDAFYERMFQQISQSGKSAVSLCYQILAIVLLAYRPMQLMEIAHVLELPESLETFLTRKEQPMHYLVGILGDLVAQCGSFLTLQDGTIHTAHKSVEDFLRSTKSSVLFFMGETQLHRHIGEKCVETLSRKLMRDICGLRNLGVSDISRGRKDYVTDLEYACSFWACHLMEGLAMEGPVNPNHTVPGSVREQTEMGYYLGLARQFINEHFLHWLEVLSIRGRIIDAFQQLFAIGHVHENSTDDLILFLRTYRTIIEKAPLQLYSGVLLFLPEDHIIRQTFAHDFPCWLELSPVVPEDNSGDCLQVLEGHTSIVRDVAFSSRLIASAGGLTVRLWSIKNGGIQHVLQSPEHGFSHVQFSLDEQKVYGGSHQHVYIWDTISGNCERIIDCSSHSIYEIRQLLPTPFRGGAPATVSDTRICLWTGGFVDGDENDNILIYPRKSKQNVPASTPYGVIFHADGGYTTAAVRDTGEVEIRDSRTKILRRKDVLRIKDAEVGSEDSVRCAHFFQSSTSLSAVITTKLGYIHVWNLDQTAKRLQRPEASVRSQYLGTNNQHMPFEFVQDEDYLITASHGSQITIASLRVDWQEYHLRGHEDLVTNLRISPDEKYLASTSEDKTVRIWDLRRVLSKAETAIVNSENYNTAPVDRLSLSPCSTMMLSISSQHMPEQNRYPMMKVWSTETGEEISLMSTLDHQESWGTSKRHDATILGAEFLVQEDHPSLIFSLSVPDEICIWDLQTGEMKGTIGIGRITKNFLQPQTKLNVTLMRVSSDGTLLVCVTNEKDESTNEDKGEHIRLYDVSVSSLGRVRLKPWKHTTFRSPKVDFGATAEEILISPDNGFLFIIASPKVILYDVNRDSLTLLADVRIPAFRGFCFSPDGHMLAILDSDNETYNMFILDACTGSVLKLIQRTESSEIWRDRHIKKFSSTAHLCFLTFEGVPYLRTDLELFPIDVNAIDNKTHGLPDIFAFSRDYEWLYYNSKKILWIPHEFRPDTDRCWIIKDNMITFASRSGSVYIMRIDVDKLKATLDFMEHPPWF